MPHPEPAAEIVAPEATKRPVPIEPPADGVIEVTRLEFTT